MMRSHIRFFPLLLFTTSSLAATHQSPSKPIVTSAPDPRLVDLRVRQDAGSQLNPISAGEVLLTAVPSYLFEAAASDPAAVPLILLQEFRDGQVPQWFAALPTDVRTWLSEAWSSIATPVASVPSSSSPLPSDAPSSGAQSQPSVTSLPSSSPSSPTDSSDPTNATPSSTPSTSSEPSSVVPSSTSGSSTRSVASTSSQSSASTYATASSSASQSEVTATSTVVSTSTTIDASTSASASVDPTSITAPSAEQTTSNSGLSTSAKVGIGLGVPIGVLALAGLLGCCFLWRRRRQRREHQRLLDEEFDDKAAVSDTAPFVTPAQLYGDHEHHDGPYDGARFRDGEYGFQEMTMSGAVAAGAMSTNRHQHERRRSLPRLQTSPLEDPSASYRRSPSPRDLWLPTDTPYNNTPRNGGGGGMGYKKSTPRRYSHGRRGSLGQMTQIEEAEDESSDIGLAKSTPSRTPAPTTAPTPSAAAIPTTLPRRRSSSSGHSVPRRSLSTSPVQSPQRQPVISEDYNDHDLSAAAALLPRPSFRTGSLRSHRKSSGIFPTESNNGSNTAISPIDNSSSTDEGSPHGGRHLTRRKSLTIGGGYRSLPSPHLQNNGGW